MNTLSSSPRLTSIDAYRGFVMLLMMAEVLELSHLPKFWPNAAWAEFLAFHQSHVAWVGCSLHDLIQPSFSFLVGVAMMFSLKRRADAGETQGKTWRHAIQRSLVLIGLGVLLRSVGASQTYFTFEDTLSQIGLGYFFLYLVASRTPRVQWAWLAVILIGYWLAFLLYPAPGPDYPWADVAVGTEGPGTPLRQGVAAHWNMNSNAAWAFDCWFLNLFPRAEKFLFNEGGYCTLSFIPTLGTMILGLMAGRLIQDTAATAKLRIVSLLKLAVLCWGLGLAWHFLGFCPIVKRIWTPSWTLFSGGTCFALLAGFYALLDARPSQKPARWAFPLLVIGANSIVAYFIAHLWPEFIKGTVQTHFGFLLQKLSKPLQHLTESTAVLLCLWAALLLLWRRRWFIRV